jgi:hypothetical protein
MSTAEWEKQGVWTVMCVCTCGQKISRGLEEIDVVPAKGQPHLGMIHVEGISGCLGSLGEAIFF